MTSRSSLIFIGSLMSPSTSAFDSSLFFTIGYLGFFLHLGTLQSRSVCSIIPGIRPSRTVVLPPSLPAGQCGCGARVRFPGRVRDDVIRGST
jgi:hypothetical protein